MEKLLDIQGIKKQYGSKKVLQGIDLKMEKGEFITIRGESGSGKSTLLNMLGLLDTYDAGTYRMHGKVVKGRRRRNQMRMKEIGFIFQSYCLLDHLSVADNISMPILYNEIPYDKKFLQELERYLELFQLRELRNVKAKYLSGGEKQRVAIVRALMKKPSLILADEPTGNLDYDNSQIIVEELLKMKKKGKGIIMVTHDVHRFSGVDTGYQLVQGKLRKEGKDE